MKQFLCVVAMLALATTGCAGNRMMGKRLACCDPGCGCCEVGCGCCEPECGCCEPECGCDPGCGVCDPCCGDTCCTDGSCGPGGCRIGNGGRLGNGRFGNGGACGYCGGAGCNHCCGGIGHGFVGAVASGFCPHAGGYPEMYNFNPGPPTGQTAYPYYTTRGPRDFLRNNPPSIGPY